VGAVLRLKSLAISEKQGNLHVAASTYHQLGMVAQRQGEFAAALERHLKSLAIWEKQGDLHSGASTYGQLGILAGLEGRIGECGRLLVRCIAAFRQTQDEHTAERNIRGFLLFHKRASTEDKQKLEAIWREAGFGPFPGATSQ
jgi:Tetratricopeptide repeat